MGDKNDNTQNFTLYNENFDPVNIEEEDLKFRLVVNAATYKKGIDTLDSLNDEMVLDTKGYSTLATNILGTFVGEIEAFASVDGTNYFPVTIVDRANASVISAIIVAGAYIINCSGYMYLKLIMSTYTSGGVDVAYGMALGGGIVESFGASGVVNTVVIRDRTNPLYEAEVDSQGRLKVSIAASQSHTIEMRYQDTVGPLKADMWQDVGYYEVPAGYKMEAIRFNASAANSTSWARTVIATSMGSFDMDTDVFTAGDSIDFPGFASSLSITLLEEPRANMTITFTYVNQSNVGGRTATIDLSGPPVSPDQPGYQFRITLQAGDLGVRDVTNVVSSVPLAGGSFDIFGYTQVFVEKMTTSGEMYTQFAPREALNIDSGQRLLGQYQSGQTASVFRLIEFSGLLVPV